MAARRSSGGRRARRRRGRSGGGGGERGAAVRDRGRGRERGRGGGAGDAVPATAGATSGERGAGSEAEGDSAFGRGAVVQLSHRPHVLLRVHVADEDPSGPLQDQLHYMVRRAIFFLASSPCAFADAYSVGTGRRASVLQQTPAPASNTMGTRQKCSGSCLSCSHGRSMSHRQPSSPHHPNTHCTSCGASPAATCSPCSARS